MPPSTGDVTRLLRELRSGNPEAEAQLFPMVYRHLHRLAKSKMRGWRPDHTLQASALVNETYLRLVTEEGKDWRNRAHFFRVAAKMMRNILVSYARAQQAGKRGGKEEKLPLDDVLEFSPAKAQGLIELHDALDSLGRLDPRQAEVVELRFFGGMTVEETAEALGIAPRTVKREWQTARAWLHGQLSGSAGKPKGGSESGPMAAV